MLKGRGSQWYAKEGKSNYNDRDQEYALQGYL